MRTVQPYASGRGFLGDYTNLLRLKLEREVAVVRAQRASRDRPASVDAVPKGPQENCADAEVATLEAGLFERVEATPEPPQLWRLAGMFGLSAAERGLVLVLLVSGLDERFGRVYAYLHDDATRRWLTPGLAWRLLGLDALSPEAHSLFAPESPLIAYELVRVMPAEHGLPLISRPLALDDRIAAYLLGADVMDERINDFVSLSPPSSEGGPHGFDGGQRTRLTNLRDLWSQTMTPSVCFHGPAGAGKGAAVRHLANALARPLLVVDAQQMPQSLAGARVAWRHVQREQRLRGAIVYARNTGSLDEAVRQCLAREAAPGTIFGTEADAAAWRDEHGMLGLEFPVASHGMRNALWLRQLGAVDHEENGETARMLADELGGRFRLTPGQVEQAAATARRLAWLRRGPESTPERDDYFEGARRQSAIGLGSMAQKVTSGQTWDDLVLPPAVVGRLKAIVSQVRNAAVVYERWGFGAGQSYGRGLAALFSGPSGTGKTMSAGVIARALGLDMYKIDLARVVSKYIGETEKNLDRVFTEAMNANAVLFFDEADALFGKRSEVKDAHDRYANIEISYLLQKMEEYEGLAILATNFGQNLDEAFNRRLHFIIEFPLPRVEDRAAIWRSHIPRSAPVADGIDFEFLAHQFELTGGGIRNCVRSAAFAAAEANAPIGMAHLVQAVAGELAKLGRPLQRSDFGEYFGSVTEGRRVRAEAVSNGNGAV